MYIIHPHVIEWLDDNIGVGNWQFIVTQVDPPRYWSFKNGLPPINKPRCFRFKYSEHMMAFKLAF
jgi:hypothetical protein